VRPDPIIQLRQVARDFYDGRQSRRVLFPLDLAVHQNELTIISGPSGSGKTTLLAIMALILRPSQGRVFIRQQDVAEAAEDLRATLRLRHFGFVFQNAALIPALSVFENAVMAAAVQGGAITAATRRRATEALDTLGMADFKDINVSKLSGGQKQRVAIARALVNDPELILCDEPTSALDVESSASVLKILKRLSTEGRAIVLVTHDPRVFPYADRLVQLVDGKIATDTGTKHATEANTDA
jgi:putative ABC transport system ATP-binding protein